MATITPDVPGLTAAAPTVSVASAGGDLITPHGDDTLYLRLKNANVSTARTVTMDDPTSASPDGATQFNPDVAWVVGASATVIVTIRNPKRFINTSDGKIHLTYSSEADLTMECYR